MTRPATSSRTPSTQPPGANLRGGPRKQSSLSMSHEQMRQLLVRLQATITVHANDPILNRKLVLDYLPEIVSAISMAKWAGGK